MSPTIAVKPSQIRAIIDASFPDYRGSKASVVIKEQVSYTVADLTWQEGSRTEVVLLRWNGESIEPLAVGIGARDLDLMKQGFKAPIPADVILVEHVIFCGKDLGIRCIVAPDCVYLPKLQLAAPVELTPDEVLVLSAHAQLKSSYRAEAYTRADLSPSALTLRIDALVSTGFLSRNKLGATQITLAGKNALAALPKERQVRL